MEKRPPMPLLDLQKVELPLILKKWVAEKNHLAK
jgi:hypothetical protein